MGTKTEYHFLESMIKGVHDALILGMVYQQKMEWLEKVIEEALCQQSRDTHPHPRMFLILIAADEEGIRFMTEVVKKSKQKFVSTGLSVLTFNESGESNQEIVQKNEQHLLGWSTAYVVVGNLEQVTFAVERLEMKPKSVIWDLDTTVTFLGEGYDINRGKFVTDIQKSYAHLVSFLRLKLGNPRLQITSFKLNRDEYLNVTANIHPEFHIFVALEKCVFKRKDAKQNAVTQRVNECNRTDNIVVIGKNQTDLRFLATRKYLSGEAVAVHPNTNAYALFHYGDKNIIFLMPSQICELDPSNVTRYLNFDLYGGDFYISGVNGVRKLGLELVK